MNQDPSHDLIVVGAGLAGLAAAIEAADGGAHVLILEARDSVGGRARTHTREGFLLNEGPHAFYRSGAAFAFLAELGLNPTGGEPDAGAGVGVDGALVGPLPTGLRSLLRTPLLVGERLAFGRLFARLGHLKTADYDRVTIAAAVEQLLGVGRAAELLHALLRLATYGNDPFQASAGPALAQLRDAAQTPVLYLDHGWQRLVDDLVGEARKRNVEIRTGVKVDELKETTTGVGVSGSGRQWWTESVVVAGMGPSGVAALLADGPTEVAAWADSSRPSTVAVLDVGLRAPWGDHPTFALGISEPLYLSVHAPLAELAKPDHSLVHVMRYHRPGEQINSQLDRACCEGLLDQIRPGWRDVAGHVGFRRRLVAAHDQPRADRGGLAGRPGPGVPGHPRIRVAGDWVGAEGLLADAGVASGRAAAQAAAS